MIQQPGKHEQDQISNKSDRLRRVHFLSTPIYVDSKLGDGVIGEEFAKELHEQGFQNLYLATGRQPESLPPMPWIKEVDGKKAPWA